MDNYIRAYQAAAWECGAKPRILIDMQGPELRVGALKEPLFLKEQEIFCLEYVPRNEEAVADKRIPIPQVVIDTAGIFPCRFLPNTTLPISHLPNPMVLLL